MASEDLESSHSLAERFEYLWEDWVNNTESIDFGDYFAAAVRDGALKAYGVMMTIQWGYAPTGPPFMLYRQDE